jgi:hypothetical protein
MGVEHFESDVFILIKVKRMDSHKRVRYHIRTFAANHSPSTFTNNENDEVVDERLANREKLSGSSKVLRT